jgi:hypothetical protein
MRKLKCTLWEAAIFVLIASTPCWGTPLPLYTPQPPSKSIAEYQNAISRAYPGYQILPSSEIFLDKDSTYSELYDQIKGSPALLTGNFNGDKFEDFVALIRNSTLKEGEWAPRGKGISKDNAEQYDVYQVNAVLCHGTSESAFDCKLLPGDFNQTRAVIFGRVYVPSPSASKTNRQYLCTTIRLEARAGGMFRYRDNHTQNNNDDVTTSLDGRGYSEQISVTKMQENVRYALKSDLPFLQCSKTDEEVPDPAPIIPSPYQAAVDKAFPNHRILAPSEIALYKDEIGDALYNQIKDNPGLTVGKFNIDNIEDFAALLKDTSLKTYHLDSEDAVDYETFKGYLTICYGLGNEKYDCLKVSGQGSEFRFPHPSALSKTGPGKYLCTDGGEVDLSANYSPYRGNHEGKTIKNLAVKTDVINLITTTHGWAVKKYIYRSRDTLLRCMPDFD